MRLLEGKHLVVTGGSRGIGAGIVRAAMQEGAEVAFLYRRSADLAQALVQELTALHPGQRCFALQADVASVMTRSGSWPSSDHRATLPLPSTDSSRKQLASVPSATIAAAGVSPSTGCTATTGATSASARRERISSRLVHSLIAAPPWQVHRGTAAPRWVAMRSAAAERLATAHA